MTDYEILKKEESLCNQIWAIEPYRDFMHYHRCDFELIHFRHCKNLKQLDKLVEKKCKEYLKSIGQKRDKDMWCCDHCIHDRYLTVSEKEEDLVLNIATLGLDSRKLQNNTK